ncbi:aspartyl-phosphate phosphatase Spo0E family protein [Neobacillus jeddahensis]|uniref:aspartyl-phosphate phosphatase Spo0E family protein n=1 Tax=Neobacillus jeddahensis TaxID=1461580 RepID=UPI0009DCA7BD|nr:aspartyl-phosphate phosphatase Spo0E family protein [Neobacillus jeddahensis]
MTYLLLMIEQHRQALAELVAKHGISSPEAVACSEQLDHYLNLLLMSEENRKSSQVEF